MTVDDQPLAKPALAVFRLPTPDEITSADAALRVIANTIRKEGPGMLPTPEKVQRVAATLLAELCRLACPADGDPHAAIAEIAELAGQFWITQGGKRPARAVGRHRH